MKASAEKSSSTSAATATQAAPQPFFTKAAGGDHFFAPVHQTSTPAAQMKMAVNQPGDKFEQEADKTATKVMRLPSPASPEKEEKLQRQADERLQKAALPEEKIQKQEKEKLQKSPTTEESLQRRSSEGTPAVDTSVQSGIRTRLTGGRPLASDVRSYMEPRFNADFSNVRVHSDPEAAKLSNQLSARAFTYQSHIFFSRDQYQPGTGDGKQLLAHELTHTIQQGHAVQRQPLISTAVTQPHIQRSAVGEILDWFADKANYIPGFRMFTIVLGVNPINMSSVDRSAANILRALIEFIPGGAFIATALDNHGVFTKVAVWIEQQIQALGMVGQMFKNALTKFIDSLGVSDLAPWNWGDVWNRAKSIFTAPIDRLIAFAKGVVTDIIKFVKDAILKPLAALAQGTRGYDLLCALLGEDPITGEPVPRTADTLIGGFMKLIGQEEIWENLKKGNAVARAWAWFQGALAGLLGFARAIPRRIIDTLTSLTIQDIVTVAGAFAKIVGAFINIAGEFYSWAFSQVISLLEILFSVVAPAVMPYLKKAQTAFVSILKNPIGFVGNLVQAGKLGFQMFAGNILLHLKAALIKWIVGPLAEAGVYIPQSFSLIEIVKLVLSVLGLTWQAIRAKLVKIIPEPVLAGLEKTAGILVTLVKDGPVAAWEQIKAELSELKDQMIAQVTQMISVEVVKAAIVKLVSMLNPAGAVIQAIIAIYNTISFFIEKIQQIAAVVASFIDSIAAIAAGMVAGAAKKVEQTMANTLTVVIAFLAKFAGLGGIPAKITGIIKKIRGPIDKGLDKIVTWLGNMLKKLAAAVLQVGVPQDPQQRLEMGLDAAVKAVNVLTITNVSEGLLSPVLQAVKVRYGFSMLRPVNEGGNWLVEGVINPGGKRPTKFGKSSGDWILKGGWEFVEVLEGITVGTRQAEVHLLTNHDKAVTTKFLTDRLRETVGLFEKERHEYINTRYGRLSDSSKGIESLTKKKQVAGISIEKANEYDAKIKDLERQIDNLYMEIEEANNVNTNDREAMETFMKDRLRKNFPFSVSKFSSISNMRASVTKSIELHQQIINTKFDEGNNKIDFSKHRDEIGLEIYGEGVEYDANMEISSIERPFTHVRITLLVLDRAKKEYVIQTAFPSFG